MTDYEVLRFEADTERGTIELTQGRAFLGGTYNVQLIVDKHEAGDYRLALFVYENLAKPLYVGTVSNEEDSRLSFSIGALVECYRPNARVWDASIPVYAYLYKELPITQEELDQMEEHQKGEAVPANIIAEGRIALLWSPMFGAHPDGETPITAVGPRGSSGEKGEPGKDGKDGITYIPVLRMNEENGLVFVDWTYTTADGEVRTIVGKVAITGPQGDKGEPGPQGNAGYDGKNGVSYVPRLRTETNGVFVDWYPSDGTEPTIGTVSIRGPQGDKGEPGKTGAAGKSAYQIAVENGYEGTEEEFSQTVSNINESASYASVYAERARIYAEGGGTLPALPGGVTLPAVVKGSKQYSVEAKEFRDEAVTAKTLAETAKDQAEGFATQASTSASNASKSATDAKASETNAKASATQAENATVLKVDQRINTEDNSEYPLVVMVDKDVYKFIAPKGAKNSSACRYCCDGMGHYFGFLNGHIDGNLYEYDGSLNFVRKIVVTWGQDFKSDSYHTYDFCTKIGDNYFIRSCAHPYTTEYIRKYDANGTQLANCVIVRDAVNTRICRNERTNHLLVFTKFTADTTMGEHTVHANKKGYTIYDENLVALGVRELDCPVTTSGGVNTYFNWLQHLNIVGNSTLITYAPTDTNKTSLYYLDENDNLVAVAGTVIRGSGAFTSEDLTSTGRTSASYFVPRMFYDQRYYSNGQHTINLTNGAQWFRVFLNTDKSISISTVSWQNPFIKASSLPQAKYDSRAIFYSNGSGSNNGGAQHSQPIVALTSSGIVTKIAEMYNTPNGFTDFAPDPFANNANFSRAITGNSRLAKDTVATTRAYQLYPAGTYGQAGGAIMFTV